MEILERISHVQAALSEDTSAAVTLMAESICDYFRPDALREFAEDPKLLRLFALAEDGALADRHSAEADAISKRAWKLHKRKKSPLQTKIQAHDHGEEQHTYAMLKHHAAGNKEKADYHAAQADKHHQGRKALGVKHDYDEAVAELQSALEEAAADYAARNRAEVGDAAEKNLHSRRAFDRSQRATSPSEHRFAARGHREAAEKNPELKAQHLKAADAHDKAASAKEKAEALTPAQTAAKDAQTSAHMAQWRAGQLKKKLAAKKSTIVAWMESLEEGGYSDEVKNASMNAAKATAKAKASGSVDDHGTAAVAHRIARDLAKSGGHHDLAAKHDDFHQKHVTGSKAAKVA